MNQRLKHINQGSEIRFCLFGSDCTAFSVCKQMQTLDLLKAHLLVKKLNKLLFCWVFATEHFCFFKHAHFLQSSQSLGWRCPLLCHLWVLLTSVGNHHQQIYVYEFQGAAESSAVDILLLFNVYSSNMSTSSCCSGKHRHYWWWSQNFLAFKHFYSVLFC